MNVTGASTSRYDTVIVESLLRRDDSLLLVKDFARQGSLRTFRNDPDILPVFVLHHLEDETESLRPWQTVLSWFRDIARGVKAHRIPAALLPLPDDLDACTAFLNRTLREFPVSRENRVLVHVRRLEEALSPTAVNARAVLQSIETTLANVEATLLEASARATVRIPDPELTVMRAPTVMATNSAAPAAIGTLDTAIEVRDRLLREEAWLSSPAVSQRVRGRVPGSNGSEFAKRLRQAKRLFGVRLGKSEYRHPEFQFDKTTGALNPAMRRLMAVLPTSDANWAAAFWLFQPNYWLRGDRPADRFPTDPEAVITAAEKDFRHGQDGP